MHMSVNGRPIDHSSLYKHELAVDQGGGGAIAGEQEKSEAQGQEHCSGFGAKATPSTKLALMHQRT
jgi:hypothetical protein